MRKVFLSVMLLAPLNRQDPTYYTSDDFDLGDVHYDFPLSYIFAQNIEADDKICFITAVEQSEQGKTNNAMVNYQLFVEEIKSIAADKQIELDFIEIPLTKDFDSLTFNKFFKQVADLIHDDDQLFSDITFGMKPYSFSMFIALAYAAKAAKNVDVDTVIYSQKYTGFSRNKTPEELKTNPSKARIYDLTGLFYLNAIAGSAKPGQKENLDKVLGLIIND